MCVFKTDVILCAAVVGLPYILTLLRLRTPWQTYARMYSNLHWPAGGEHVALDQAL